MNACPKCGKPMQVLFQQWVLYGSSCEDSEEEEDPWGIEYKSAKDCDCKPKFLYTHDDPLRRRACGSKVASSE